MKQLKNYGGLILYLGMEVVMGTIIVPLSDIIENLFNA